MNKPPHFFQTNPSSCVSACIRMILDFYGLKKTEFEIRELCGDDGTGLESSKAVKAILELGFNCDKPDNLAIEDLIDCVSDNLFPIAYLRFNPNAKYAHAVVVYKISNEKVFVLDPQTGEREIDINQFAEIWSRGSTIIIENKQ